MPTIRLQAHALARTYTAEATIEALRQATVAAQVQGRVLETRVDAARGFTTVTAPLSGVVAERLAEVMVAFPGASAKDVEALVARPAQQVLAPIAGMDPVYSVSRPGMAVITVQFKVGVKNQDDLVRLYDTLHSYQNWISPQPGVAAPIVKPKGIDDVPVVALTLWTCDPARSGFELQQVARAVEVELKRVPDTRDVTTLLQSGFTRFCPLERMLRVLGARDSFGCA